MSDIHERIEDQAFRMEDPEGWARDQRRKDGDEILRGVDPDEPQVAPPLSFEEELEEQERRARLHELGVIAHPDGREEWPTMSAEMRRAYEAELRQREDPQGWAREQAERERLTRQAEIAATWTPRDDQLKVTHDTLLRMATEKALAQPERELRYVVSMDHDQLEGLYHTVRDVLMNGGVPYPRACHFAEHVRTRYQRGEITEPGEP